MENLLGALFLIVMAGLTLLRKVQEQREEKYGKPPPPDAAEEIADKVREFFYGQHETAEKAEQQAMPHPPEAVGPQPMAPRHAERESMAQTMARTLTQHAEMQRPRPHKPARRKAAPAPEQREEEHPGPQRRTRHPIEVAPPMAPVRARRRARSMHTLLNDLDDVRRGIILGEILGPPKGLQ